LQLLFHQFVGHFLPVLLTDDLVFHPRLFLEEATQRFQASSSLTLLDDEVRLPLEPMRKTPSLP